MFVTELLSYLPRNDFISKPQSENPQGNLLGSLVTTDLRAPGSGPVPAVVTWQVSLSLDQKSPLSTISALFASQRVLGCLELLDCRGQKIRESDGVICVVVTGTMATM